MISNISSSAVSGTFANSLNENKELKPNAKLTASEDGSKNRIEKLKEAIESGEYKVDLSALSEKMADELLK
ncbi:MULTISPECIES: flagellar biosynthesis anti-sigma factor FlgM [Sulfurimonas]|uniref:flagellar biosynthesis anti-sigma factor FlgM n=1 Tax=Sulfurimonas TaxID=202746 RepID=UPI001264243D|nr:flagellar biosynthesis anti-sigma factor FlgM [Sulfurimonas indica]